MDPTLDALAALWDASGTLGGERAPDKSQGKELGHDVLIMFEGLRRWIEVRGDSAGLK